MLFSSSHLFCCCSVFVIYNIYLLFCTPFLLQYLYIGHFEHHGLTGMHIFFPWLTNASFSISQYFFGTIFSSSFSVCSGVLVSTHPSLFDILWTCVSTGIASTPCAYTNTQFATFLPTPGSFSSSSIVSGIFPVFSIIFA